jgi:hypothetical protein
VVIKGAVDEEAVLCTQDKTFALKLVETTNLLLLLPPQEVRAKGHLGAVRTCGAGTAPHTDIAAAGAAATAGAR